MDRNTEGWNLGMSHFNFVIAVSCSLFGIPICRQGGYWRPGRFPRPEARCRSISSPRIELSAGAASDKTAQATARTAQQALSPMRPQNLEGVWGSALFR
jgi:hypothetical protein